MKSDGLAKHLVLVFLMALVVYVTFYSCDRHLRLRKGPWQVSFQVEPTGEPSISVSQAKLAIKDVKVIFSGESTEVKGLPVVVDVDVPRKTVPFGKIIFDDPNDLPGTVVFDLFGHEIELLPRALFVDRKEYAWSATTMLRSRADEKVKKPEATPR